MPMCAYNAMGATQPLHAEIGRTQPQLPQQTRLPAKPNMTKVRTPKNRALTKPLTAELVIGPYLCSFSHLACKLSVIVRVPCYVMLTSTTCHTLAL